MRLPSVDNIHSRTELANSRPWGGRGGASVSFIRSPCSVPASRVNLVVAGTALRGLPVDHGAISHDGCRRMKYVRRHGMRLDDLFIDLDSESRQFRHVPPARLSHDRPLDDLAIPRDRP